MSQTRTRWYLILVPISFFAKRLIIASILVTGNKFLWIQVALLNFTALASIGITLWYMPLESFQANVFEVFNDCTLLSLTYLLWCFTDIVGEPETRHELGYVFIAVSLGNIAVHMIFLIYESIYRAKLSCKRCTNKRRAKKRMADL